MASSYSKLTKTLSGLTADSPYVIAERLSRLGDASSLFSAKDQAEFSRMVMEKQAAATEAYLALLSTSTSYYQKAWTDLAAGKWGFGMVPTGPSAAKAVNDMLRPYQKRASANARRLGKGT